MFIAQGSSQHLQDGHRGADQFEWQPFLSPLSTIHHGWVHAAANERTRALSKIRWSQQHNHGMADNTLKVDE